MITQELQNYIQQSRAKGMTDEQIRQGLLSNGWNQADVEQALGGQSTPLGTGYAPQKNNTKLIIILLLIFVGLPFLIWVGFAGFAYWQLKNNNIFGIGLNNSLQNYTDTKNDNSEKETGCGSSKTSIDLPSDWPSDIPIYPGSKLINSGSFGSITTGTGGMITVGYCTLDSVDAVVKYFSEQNTPWNIKTFVSSNQSGKQNTILVGSFGDKNINIGITGNSEETKIEEILSSKR